MHNPIYEGLKYVACLWEPVERQQIRKKKDLKHHGDLI